MNRRVGEFLASFTKPSTVASYRRTLNRLLEFIQEAGGPTPDEVDFRRLVPRTATNGEVLYYDPLDRQVLRAFLLCQMRKGDTAQTLARHVGALRAFCEFLRRVGEFPDNPALYLPIPKVPPSGPRNWLEVEEVTALLEAAVTGPAPTRDFSMLLCLGLVGLRPGEVCGLLIGNVEFESGVIYVHNQTKRDPRVVPLPSNLAEALRQYLDASAGSRPPTDRLFISDRGKPFTGGTLATHLQRMAKRAGLSRRITPYTFRHSAATLFYLSGAALTDVQELLGHKKLKTTVVYTHGIDLKQPNQVYNRRPERVLGQWLKSTWTRLEGRVGSAHGLQSGGLDGSKKAVSPAGGRPWKSI